MAIKEIGSEFWNVPILDKKNSIFPNSTQWFLSGRSALQAIIKELEKGRRVFLPSWCCDSMIKPFVDAGLEVSFYPVYWHEGQLIQEIEYDSDVLLVIDYFGYTGQALELNGYKGTVIRDITHSIFTRTYTDADFYFGSLRKWCGIWSGGYSWTRDGHMLHIEHTNDNQYVFIRNKAMQMKSQYIAGMQKDKEYLRYFAEAEELLENVEPFPAAERDVQLAKMLDVETIKNRRIANAEVLRSAFHDWLIFPVPSSNDIPLFVPVLIPDGKRDELRRYLINNEIYCPIHWPVSKYHRLTAKEQFIYDNELSLICDQRYTEEDMYRIVDTIQAFWEKV